MCSGCQQPESAYPGVQVITVAPAFLSAFTCQQNIHSMQESLRAYSLPRMRTVIARACTITAALYAMLTLAGMAVFGPSAAGDMLQNLGRHSLRDLGCSPWVAAILAPGMYLLLLTVFGRFSRCC